MFKNGTCQQPSSLRNVVMRIILGSHFLDPLRGSGLLVLGNITLKKVWHIVTKEGSGFLRGSFFGSFKGLGCQMQTRCDGHTLECHVWEL